MRVLGVLVMVFSLFSLIILVVLFSGWMVGDFIFGGMDFLVLIISMIFGSFMSFSLGLTVFFHSYSVFCSPPDSRHCRKIIETDFDCETCKWKVG